MQTSFFIRRIILYLFRFHSLTVELIISSFDPLPPPPHLRPTPAPVKKKKKKKKKNSLVVDIQQPFCSTLILHKQRLRAICDAWQQLK